MSIQMRRTALPELKENGKKWDNPGLFFDKGFWEWKDDNGKRGEDIGDHIRVVCDIPVSDVYKVAYRRWLAMTEDTNRFARWFGCLEGTRLFIGMGMAHVLETQVCRHPVYGMPCIPGSALKGLARAKATEYLKAGKAEKDGGTYGITQDVINILFGVGSDEQEEADAGYLVFHDAWWIPGGEEGGSENKPYIPEIVTVHAVEYYKNQGENPPHPDMESPNPNQQLAVQGSFYFVVEGVRQWAELGMRFLTLALQAEGIGGKVAAGYGYFVKDEHALDAAEKINMSPEERIRATVDDWDIEKIPRKFGRDYKKTMKKLYADFGDISSSVVREHLWTTYGDEINSWKNEDKKTAKGKAFRNLTRDKNSV